MLDCYLCFPSDYGYVRDPDTDKCKPAQQDHPELCLNGDVEKLKDSLGCV